PTIASHGLTSTFGSGSIGRASSFSSRIKQSCTLLNLFFFASLRSRSEKERQTARERSRTNGCSILLNHPIKRVAKRRGIRLVRTKFRLSQLRILAISDRTVIRVS